MQQSSGSFSSLVRKYKSRTAASTADTLDHQLTDISVANPHNPSLVGDILTPSIPHGSFAPNASPLIHEQQHSVAAAAAYAYRTTPYYYFYPGASDFVSAAFDSTLANSGVPSNSVGEPEQCKVCGDYASGVHFGVLTCEGCKGFFKRNHRDGNANPDNKSTPLTCNRDQKCEINVASRNSCRSCRYRKCLAAGMSRESIKLGRRSKNEKVILSKDCEKSSTRNNGLMTFITPRSLTNSIASFSPYADFKNPLKPFGSTPSYNVTDGYLPHRPSSYGFSLDYPSYRNDPNFYIPSQANAAGIYSGINPMEPMNSFDLYNSTAANQNAAVATSMHQLSTLGSHSSLLPSLHMPKVDIQPSTNSANSSQNPNASSPGFSGGHNSELPTGPTNFNSHFLNHHAPVTTHGFFPSTQSENLAASFAAHNPIQSNTPNNSNSWSLIDHIVTY